MIDVEFIEKTVGKPWVNRAEGGDAYDCWGLVIASFRDIDGVQLPVVDGYKNSRCSTRRAAKEALDTGLFILSQPTNGAIMTVLDNRGNITHVGRCLCSRVLHSIESFGVKCDTYTTINSQFKNVRYYKYAPD